MAPLPDASAVIRLTLGWSYSADSNVMSRIYFQYGGSAPDNAELNAMCSDVSGYYSTYLAGSATTDVTLDSVEMRDLSSDTSAVGAFTSDVPGTLSGEALAAGTATLLNFQVNRHYRGGKPRIYLPFGGAASLGSATSWGSTFITNLTAAWNSFMEHVLADGWSGSGVLEQVNVSYYYGYTLGSPQPGGYRKKVATPRSTPVIDNITGFVVNGKPASQRRRNLHKS